MVAPEHEARVDVSCVACGESTTESVYRVRRLRQLTCGACGSAIDLSSDAAQRQADRAEGEWQARWKQGQGAPTHAHRGGDLPASRPSR